MDKPIIGAIYRHRKGGRYIVLDFARHTETEELLVLYVDPDYMLNEEVLMWARPLEMFCDGRFEKVENGGDAS